MKGRKSKGHKIIQKYWQKRDKSVLIAWAVMAFYLLFVSIPFFFTFISSLKPTFELTNTPVSYLPKNPTIGPYIDVLFQRAYGRYVINTIIVSLSVVSICAVLGTPAAYALGRFSFRFKGGIIGSTMAVRLIPPISLMVPFFLVVRFLGGMDTLWALIVADTMLNLPFFIWIAWGYFRTLPRELEEAARIDGATRLQSMWKVAIPLAAPGLAAAAIVTFLLTWNEYIFVLTFAQTAASKTISVGISDFVGDIFTEWNVVSAAGIITIIPAIIFVVFFQQYIAKGLTSGGVKG